MQQVSKVKILYHISALALSLMAGALIGTAIIPVMFKHMPGDTARSLAILKDISTRAGKGHNACFLGNSVVMNGINTGLISDADISVWNYSSPGQTLLESSFVLCQTPDNYRMAIVGISADGLCTNKVNISAEKATAYRMYGYTPTESFGRLAEAVGDESLNQTFRENQLRCIIKGRWIVRNGFDMYIRNLLRQDLDLKRAETDMLYPSPYRSRVSDDVLELLIERYYQPRTEEQAVIAPANRLILQYMAEQLKDRGGRLVLVILPEHPARRLETNHAFFTSFEQQLKQLQADLDIELINCIDLLSSEEFIDHIHPSPKGAEHLTSEVANHLRNLPTIHSPETDRAYVSHRN